MNIHIIGPTAIDQWTKTVLEMDRIQFTDFADAAVVIVGDEETLVKNWISKKDFILLSNDEPKSGLGESAVWVTIPYIVDYLTLLANPSGRMSKEVRTH